MCKELNKWGKLVAIFFSISLTNGCSVLISSSLENLGGNLQQAMLNSDDPEMVAEAMPAYVLLQEALLENDPADEQLLASTARLYTAYAALLTNGELAKVRRLNNKALRLASRAACQHKNAFCNLPELTFTEFSAIIDKADAADSDYLYLLGSAWAGWIQANKDDWRAVGQLAQVKAVMNHIVQLDQNYREGEAYLYLGILESILPPALGGKPDIARGYFEKARQLSGDKNLMVLVLYAQHYARMMFDRELHDSLLNSVITANPRQKGLTLTNTLAQKRAADLLQSADDYF